MPTAHNAARQGDIAKTVLMPGDPLRAKFIADNFLEDPKQFNTVRNMLGYTGTYNGRRISIMSSGMGMPSIGIYSYELFNFYDVDNIIRIGSCGSYVEDIPTYSIILATEAWSESSYAKTQSGYDKQITTPSVALNERIAVIAKNLSFPIIKGRIHSSDVFYRENAQEFKAINRKYSCLVVEMEAFALFHNAKITGKNAACILTVSDNLVTKQETSSEERQKSFTSMMKIALELAD